MVTAHSVDIPSSSSQGKSILLLALIGALLLSGVYYYQSGQYYSTRNKVEMKSSGKSGKHANPKARQSADERYKEAKTEFEKLDSKVDKTPEDKSMLEKWRTQMKHWKKKKDWSGEQHSQKNKGN
ncbi:MAG: hypothetical protein KA165_08315 [Saprospiraceae bacterium]|nr:hypothetical protein [Saprospiraceae bacterium]